MAKQKESDPTIDDPEWSDFILSQLADEEQMDGKPLVAGLRRLAEIHIGEIVFSGPTSVETLETEHPVGKCTVVYKVEFLVKRGQKTVTKVYSDVADVWHANTDDMFAVYASATASTRAEARALRKALKLRGAAAEEITKKDASKILHDEAPRSTSEDGDERIANDQINFIDVKCKKEDLDVVAFINSGEKQYPSIYKVPKDKAAGMIKRLNKIANGEFVPDNSIKGYKENWRG